ncbi:Fur-regulated basic protein FbpA [Litchfieldia salsa]|uniref:Fur-regulated basic protein A n=1 Tax=Litchfieldia salsa TaxID=930152 RepID=A0A1H0UUG2_9BACI|nr:Fur-regulated basic protein FbpA [Litchfieldia salsa]SDP69867.1 Fur-regulated basic protein A [Litchfieldia salsa]
MTKYLRNAVEKMKNHYIDKLLESGAYNNYEDQLQSLTLSELIEEYNKISLETNR